MNNENSKLTDTYADSVRSFMYIQEVPNAMTCPVPVVNHIIIGH